MFERVKNSWYKEVVIKACSSSGIAESDTKIAM